MNAEDDTSVVPEAGELRSRAHFEISDGFLRVKMKLRATSALLERVEGPDEDVNAAVTLVFELSEHAQALEEKVWHLMKPRSLQTA